MITQYKYDAPEVVEEDLPKHAPIECEENWDETDVPDYDPTKYVEKAAVIRLPVGTAPSERKEFIKKERKRLGDIDSDEENEGEEEVQAMQLPNTSLSQGMRSKTPEQIYRNRSPHPPSRNGSSAYNCDEDPYYSRYIEERSNRSSLSGDNCDPPSRACRGDRSPSRSYRYRSPSSKHRDRSPLNNHQNRSSSRTYRDRSPSRDHRDRSSSHKYRDRSPFRKHRNNSPSRHEKANSYRDDRDLYNSGSHYRSNYPTDRRRYDDEYGMGSGSSNSYRS